MPVVVVSRERAGMLREWRMPQCTDVSALPEGTGGHQRYRGYGVTGIHNYAAAITWDAATIHMRTLPGATDRHR